MYSHPIYTALLSEITKKCPTKYKLANQLANVVGLSTEAVYRRLRDEIPFKFHEIAAIARYLNISLDALIGTELNKSQPFQLKLPNFISPGEDDIIMIDTFIEFLRTLIDSGKNIEAGHVAGTLPQDIFSKYSELRDFYIYKWYYYSYPQHRRYEDMIVPDIVKKNLDKQNTMSKKYHRTSYIFDNELYNTIVDSILFFKNIRLIDDSSIAKIKVDMLESIDYLEKMSITGMFEETGKQVRIYVLNDMNHTMSFSYICTDDFKMSMIKAFFLTSVTSTNEKVFETVKEWVRSIISTSMLITEANERQRQIYFEQQRKNVNRI
ncbi:MAG: hypothetical protein LBR84_09955 [Tannerella sp.]|jgi:hypothetical protein|nr:hypothetical protein [Tannerella sp.]